jgi:hypothetical protein
MENIYLFLYSMGLTLIISSYIFLIYYYIKEEIYKDLQVFDIFILFSGPIGLLVVMILGWIHYDDQD